MKKWVSLSFITLSLAAIGYFSFYSDEFLEETEEEEENPILQLTPEQLQEGNITFTTVRNEKIEQSLPIFGKVSLIPDKHCHVSCKAPGIVKKNFKNLGDSVREGEALAYIESRELAELHAEYQASEAKEELLKSLLDKELKLNQKHLATEEQFLHALSEYNQAEIEKKIILQKLHFFDIVSSSTFEVKAPFDGTIIKRLAALGEPVHEGKELYEMADLSQVMGEFTVYPQEVGHLAIGKEIILYDDKGGSTSSYIHYISPLVDEQSGTIMVKATIDNSHGIWRPGSNIKGKLIIENVQSDLSVPTESVVEIDDIPHVFIANENSFEPRKVQIGISDENFTQILAGVEAGEKVACGNAALLKCELTKQEPD